MEKDYIRVVHSRYPLEGFCMKGVLQPNHLYTYDVHDKATDRMLQLQLQNKQERTPVNG